MAYIQTELRQIVPNFQQQIYEIAADKHNKNTVHGNNTVEFVFSAAFENGNLMEITIPFLQNALHSEKLQTTLIIVLMSNKSTTPPFTHLVGRTTRDVLKTLAVRDRNNEAYKDSTPVPRKHFLDGPIGDPRDYTRLRNLSGTHRRRSPIKLPSLEPLKNRRERRPSEERSLLPGPPTPPSPRKSSLPRR